MHWSFFIKEMHCKETFWAVKICLELTYWGHRGNKMGYRCGSRTRSSSHVCLLRDQRLCSNVAYSQSAHQYTTVVGKQRQMLSSILPVCNFSPIPPMSFSLRLFSWGPTHFIRIFVRLSRFRFGQAGAQVLAGLPSICMVIAFSHETHWGHSSTSRVAAGTYRDPDDVRRCVSALVRLYKIKLQK